MLTSEEINLLPDNVRKYIHDLQTRCDPAGDVQRMASLEEQVEGLHNTKENLYMFINRLRHLSINGELDSDSFDYTCRRYRVDI